MTSTFTSRHYWLLTLVCVCMFATTCTQKVKPDISTPANDSLQAALDAADTAVAHYQPEELDSALKVAERLLPQDKQTIEWARFYKQQGASHLITGQSIDHILPTLDKSVAIARKLHADSLLATILNVKFTAILRRGSDKTAALPFLLEAMLIDSLAGQKHRLGMGHANLAAYYKELYGASDLVMAHLNTAFHLMDEGRDPNHFATLLYNMAAAYTERNNLAANDTAQQLFQRSWRLAKQSNNPLQEAGSIRGYADCFLNRYQMIDPVARSLNQYLLDSATRYYGITLRLMQYEPEEWGEDGVLLYSNMAECEHYKGNKTRSFQLMDSALAMLPNPAVPIVHFETLRQFAKIRAGVGQHDKVILMAHQLLGLAESMTMKNGRKDWFSFRQVYGLLAESYKHLGQLDSAHLWLGKYAEASDSLHQSDLKNKRIELEVKIDQNRLLRELASKNTTLRRQRYYLWIAIGLGLLGVALSGCLAVRWQRRRDALRFTAELKAAQASFTIPALPSENTQPIETEANLAQEPSPSVRLGMEEFLAANIAAIVSNSNDIRVVFAEGGTHTTRMPIGKAASLLPAGFVRINRSLIANPAHVRHYDPINNLVQIAGHVAPGGQTLQLEKIGPTYLKAAKASHDAYFAQKGENK